MTINVSLGSCGEARLCAAQQPSPDLMLRDLMRAWLRSTLGTTEYLTSVDKETGNGRF